ncbi:hypothetical protein [Streptomyces sp. NPDC059161]|uniref:hypothetical protein n=1 Tax=unclassified Streptomyces TaxID=2593676 RepID=UPI003660D927
MTGRGSISFDQESAELKAKAQVRLDSAPSTDPGEPSPDGADLVLKYDHTGKIGHAAFLLHQHLSSAGKHAQQATEVGAENLEGDGFGTGAALAKAGEGWRGELGVLLDGCAQMSISTTR